MENVRRPVSPHARLPVPWEIRHASIKNRQNKILRQRPESLLYPCIKKKAGHIVIHQYQNHGYNIVLDVNSGSVQIGGVDVREIDYEALLENISVVFQRSFLTRGTVFENIAMGNHAATLSQVRAAAKEAQIDDFIMSLPDGYETRVGGYGTRFSGGQKQCIAIARAIFSGRPILLLDEATSSLDEETEAKLLENLRAMTDQTVVIVTHRPAVLSICDKNIAFT